MSNSGAIEKEIKKLASSCADVQAQIRELKTQLQAVEQIPMSADEAEQWLRSQIEYRDLSKFAEAMARGQPINEWTNPLYAESYTRVENPESRPLAPKYVMGDMLPVLATVLGDQLLDRLVLIVREYADTHDGISTDERDKRMAQLRKQLRKLEEQEEAIITEAEINDIWSLRRRPDCDPAVVLGL